MTGGDTVEQRNVEHLAGTTHPPPSYSVCHAERPDQRDNGKKVAARCEDFVKTEIFIDHPADCAAAACKLGRGDEIRRGEEEEEEEEEKGDERDLSLESITTNNGAIVSSRNQPSESRPVVTGPDFQIGTCLTLASHHPPGQQHAILDPNSKGDSSLEEEEAANKTDEEKLTSISPMSDEDKLTAIFLCTDIPIEPDSESIGKKDERDLSSADNQASDCSEARLAAKKDIWEMGAGSFSGSASNQGVSLPNKNKCLPPPLETEKDLAENQDVSVAAEEEEEEEECVRTGGDDDSIKLPAASGDTSPPPPDVEEKKEEDCDYEEEVASAEGENPFSDLGLQSPASALLPDTENVTSLQVEWTKEEEEGAEILTPFGRGLAHDDAGRPMTQTQRALARSEDPQVIPATSLTYVSFKLVANKMSPSPPSQSTLVNLSLQGSLV